MNRIMKMKRTRLVGLAMIVIISIPTIMMMNPSVNTGVQAKELPLPVYPLLYGVGYATKLDILILCWHVRDVLATLGTSPWLFMFCYHGCLNKGLDP